MNNNIPPEIIPTAILVDDPRNGQPRCPNCGGHDLTTGLKLGLTAEVGNVGIKFRSTGSFLGVALLGTEPLHVDLCNSCGTVTRFYVNTVSRTWK